jgi:hypothetical protein
MDEIKLVALNISLWYRPYSIFYTGRMYLIRKPDLTLMTLPAYTLNETKETIDISHQLTALEARRFDLQFGGDYQGTFSGGSESETVLFSDEHSLISAAREIYDQMGLIVPFITLTEGEITSSSFVMNETAENRIPRASDNIRETWQRWLNQAHPDYDPEYASFLMDGFNSLEEFLKSEFTRRYEMDLQNILLPPPTIKPSGPDQWDTIYKAKARSRSGGYDDSDSYFKKKY